MVYLFYQVIYFLYPFMSLENQNKETPQRFFKLIEAGGLAFSDVIQYAIVIFGITKHGKTTFSHFATHNRLQAYTKQGGQTHYQLLIEGKSKAKIGKTMHSETQIPNKFSTNIQIKQHKNLDGTYPKLYLIDNPGQLDSFGINRVLSNAYFHYRVFSKIKNMKFVLVFDYLQFSGSNLNDITEVFSLFFKSFENLNEIKAKMIKSIALVFTKIDRSKTLKDVKEKINAYITAIEKSTLLTQNKLNFVKEILLQCINSDKIFFFHKAQLNAQIQQSDILSKINEKLCFFQRQYSKNQKNLTFQAQSSINMDTIRFSQANNVSKLTNIEAENKKTQQLFSQLEKRGSLLFKVFFQVLGQLLLLSVEHFQLRKGFSKGVNMNQINATVINLKTKSFEQKLHELIQKLKRVQFSYNQQEQYRSKRQQMVQKYVSSLKKMGKLQIFMQKILVVSQIVGFCSKYSDTNRFLKRNKEVISEAKQDFERIIFKLAHFYSKDEDFQIISWFFYHFNNYMNQMVIFTMIILPVNSKKALTMPDEKLNTFLSSFDKIPFEAVRIEDRINSITAQIFGSNKLEYKDTNKQKIIQNVCKQNPQIILNQVSKEDKTLQALDQCDLDLKSLINMEFLTFRLLRKNYYVLIKNLSQGKEPSEKLVQQVKKNIKSFILYLRSVKKMKEIVEFQQFQSYKEEVYNINYLVWTLLCKLFIILTQNSKTTENKEILLYKQTIFQFLQSSSNYPLICQYFDKLIAKIIKQFSSIEIEMTSNNKFEVCSSASMDLFLEKKKNHSQEIISNFITYSQMLSNIGLSQLALSKCYESLKYTQFCPQQIQKIQNQIKKIKLRQSEPKTWNQSQKKMNKFEASITLKKHLTQFIKQNKQIKEYQYVKLRIKN